ncbi:MAG: hypothetical protein KAJ42_01940, partial [Gemmatimonadetes bacterium]|nr:hypothetical protein [Gemmatimonadota bacterium]
MSHERMQRMHRLQPSRSLTLITSMALILVLWACEGRNFFQPSDVIVGDGTGAPAVEIQSPRDSAARPIGESVLIRVRVTDDSGIDSVLFGGVASRGNADLGTDTIVARYETKVVALDGLSVEDTVLTRELLPVQDSTREPVSLFVIAYDTAGNAASDTTSLFIGGPKVEFLTLEDGQLIQAGLSLSLRVSAADPQGILSLRIDATGAFEESIVVSFNPPVDSTIVDTLMVIPSNALGPVQLTATARNSVDVPGQDGPLFLTVVAGGAGDAIAPRISLATESPDPMELGDSVIVEVEGADDSQGSGISRAGYTVLAISPTRGDTVVLSEEVTFDPARTGNLAEGFSFPPFNVDSLSLPDTLIFEITAYAFDAMGNCGAATVADIPSSLPCATLAGGQVVADGRMGLRISRAIVAGRTVMLPLGGRIMDAVVDTIRRNLLLSNIEESVIEVFRLQEEEFLDPVRVGSEPWGISMNRGEDTLVVANSGGTNLSNVYLGPNVNSDPPYEPFEDPGRRLLTPDVVLFEVETSLDDAGFTRLRVTFIPDAEPDGFSDRPQYVAVDSTGRILFSTKTTLPGNYGTIRKAYVPPGEEFTEVRLFYEHSALAEAPDFTAIANADLVEIINVGAGDQVIIYDHLPGDTIPVSGGPSDSVSGAGNAALAAGADVWWATGRWQVPSLGFSDTTFVTASGDGGWVAFGEGSVDPIGRVIMFNAAADSITNVIQVTDLMTNASETVRGLALNHDGTLGVARGFDAYFFSTDLRKQGRADLPGGGAGAALHPLHADYPSLDNY